ncbi:Nuf2-domain-containing protein [Basidiobolus meristosporus CBS 931.73]|uniref:Nuf2-domain-containing protein n=1 Tax=Basidiobolus meristosporus CBS 931.73 TaxID=1314790 RepID=A0A1Y1XMR3_9FUNG|nr:Nuf2-domain-containing protein [Basidiobolus meristosporus CBS 931.73]|eukprot:ORX86644.1 Nuf2-domain-containing protein [Basidiobolus meristosporus CBS 931.73]
MEGGRQSKASYIYPTLKPSEILICMRDLQIPFAEEDLTKPTALRLALVYEAFVDIFMGIPKEQFEQPPEGVLDMLEHPEIHMSALTQMSFFSKLNKLMIEIGVDDFNLRDLLKPEPTHVRRILSALINFAKFREERMAMYEQYAQKTEEYNEEKNQLEHHYQELAEKVNNIKLQRAEEEPAIKKLNGANSDWTRGLKELKRQQIALSSEIENLKKKRDELNDSLTNVQFLVMNCKQDSEKVRSLIVHSPEKLVQQLEELSNTLSATKNNIATSEKRVREMQSKIDMMFFVEQDVLASIKLLEECEVEMNKYDQALQQVDIEKEEIEKKEAELRDLTIKEQQLNRQLAASQEKINRLQKHQSIKRGSIENKLKSLREEYDVISNERTTVQAKIDDYRRIADEMEAKTVELRRSMEVEMSLIQAEYTKLTGQVEYYQNQLIQAITKRPYAP